MDQERIIHVYLDREAKINRTPHVLNEYTTAVRDLLEKNTFSLKNPRGPYSLFLKIADNRLVLDIHCLEGKDIQSHFPLTKEVITLPVSPFKTIIRDYFFICDSYYKALKQMHSSQVQTIDMARRGLHNEGSKILKDLLSTHLETDDDTSRRLFTLLCVLHMR